MIFRKIIGNTANGITQQIAGRKTRQPVLLQTAVITAGLLAEWGEKTRDRTLMKDCSALKMLTIPSTANNLNATACTGVGTKSTPCTLSYPSGFTPEKEATGSGWYQWKSGYFKDLVTDPVPYAVFSGSTLTFYYGKQYNRSNTT